MTTDQYKKSYLAVVHGNMKEKEGTIDLPIYRELEDTIKGLWMREDREV